MVSLLIHKLVTTRLERRLAMDDTINLYGTPKYLTIARDLRNKIQQGVYVAGQYLPPEKDLVTIYKASRPTVRAAIAKLREMGMLEVIHGTGTRVTSPQIYQQLTNQLSFTDVIKAQGLTPKTQVTRSEYIQASETVANKLGICTGDRVFVIGRLRTANDIIISYHLSYLHPEYPVDGARLEKMLSLYRYLNEIYGLSILFTDDTIWAEPCPPEIAQMLGIRPHRVVLQMERLAYASDNQVIELSQSYLRSDRLKYKVRIYRKGKMQ